MRIKLGLLVLTTTACYQCDVRSLLDGCVDASNVFSNFIEMA